MDDKHLFRLMLIFLVPVACAVIFTMLAGLVISYITSTFMSLFVPAATLLLNICSIAIVVFTCALVLFTCAMYLIVVVGAISEVKARMRYHKFMQEHRQLELEKHLQDLAGRTHRRNTGSLHPAITGRHVSRPRGGITRW